MRSIHLLQRQVILNINYLTDLAFICQRIALSWMVQKETTTMHCSGGILADDQVSCPILLSDS